MASRAKSGLMLLAAVALAVLAYVVLSDDGDAPRRPMGDLTAGDGLGGSADPEGLSTAGTPGSVNGRRPPVGPGDAGTGPDALVGARQPSGIDLSDPATREAELRRMLTAVPVDDWRQVASIVALMPPGEPIPDDLRGVILRELESGKRLQVMHVFAQLRDESFVRDLFDVLESAEASKTHVRAALEALWKMPGGEDDAIAVRLESSLRGDPRKDVSILRAIGKRGGPEAARAMVEYLQRVKNPSDLQAHVLQSLDVSTDKAAAEIVANALATEASPKVQRALISMVMRPGASDLTEPLMAIDRDGVSDDVRSMALRALGRIGDEKATAYLIQKAGEPGVFGERALTAVARLDSADPKVGALLASALADADRNPRPEQAKASYLRALGNARHEPSLPIIARSLADRDPAVRGAAIQAMGSMGAQAAGYVDRLVTVYEGGDAGQQQRVAVALANIGGEAAIKEMRRLLAVKDVDPSVRRTLQVGLRNAEAKLAGDR